MMSTTQLLVSRLPQLGVQVERDERAVDHDEEPCAICGGTSATGVTLDDFIGSSLTDQNTFKSPSSKHVCLACAYVRARLAIVPGVLPKPCDMCEGTVLQPSVGDFAKRMLRNAKRKPKRAEGEACEKCDGTKVKESGGRYPNFSHFIDDDRLENASKGEKPKILAWLRGPKRGYWACAVSDTGQKHVLPYTPLNPPKSRGRIRFEEQEIALPAADDWRVVDEATELLTMGATKEELETGNYSARAWQLCGDALRRFEREFGGLRGGAWFSLVVWLAQRDEERVAVRLEAEKSARAEKEKARGTGRKGTRKATDDAGGDAPGLQSGVLQNARSKPAGALEDTPGSLPDKRAVLEQRGRVGNGRRQATPDPVTGQTSLFDLA